MSAGFEREEFLDGDGFGVGGGEEELGRKFVKGHVFFDAEGRDSHGESVAVRGRGVERQIGREEGRVSDTVAIV